MVRRRRVLLQSALALAGAGLAQGALTFVAQAAAPDGADPLDRFGPLRRTPGSLSLRGWACVPIHVKDTGDSQDLAEKLGFAREALARHAATSFGVSQDRLGLFEHFFGVNPAWLPIPADFQKVLNEPYYQGVFTYVADVELLPLAEPDHTEGGTRGTWGKRLPTSPMGPARLTKLSDR